jgi:hypothetical protein
VIAEKEGFISRETGLLTPSLFYYSKQSTQRELKEWISAACDERPNCLPSWEASPPAEMLKEAAMLRASQGLNEPMFRTLLRIRRKWKSRMNL